MNVSKEELENSREGASMRANFMSVVLALLLMGTSLLGLPACADGQFTNWQAPKDTSSLTRFEQQRIQMVERQLRDRGIRDEAVLDAMSKVPRHKFVPLSQVSAAYEDRPLPIGYEQTISQPYIVAYMTEAADISPTDVVLEIGTGSGYQAAILGELAKEVYTIEIVPELAERASSTLSELGYQNIFTKQGDGYIGWEEHAPYDAILVTAAPDHIPQPLVEQLVPNGKLVIPVGTWFQELLVLEKTQDGLVKERSLPVRFVPLVEEQP